MITFQIKSLFVLLLIAGRFCMISCQKQSDPPAPTTPCLIGSWGNDYKTCPISSSLTQGTGSLTDRQAQELKLVFRTDSTGDFLFYDCQNMKYADGTVRFKYRVDNDKITFAWQGNTEDQILAILNEFNYKSTYTFQCKGDSLLFPETMIGIQYRYNSTRYFLRR